MLPALIILLFFQIQLALSLNLRLDNFLSSIIKDVSSKLLNPGAYVDHQKHQTPRSFSNHEQWHQRHVVAFTNASSVVYMTLSAPTGFPSTISLGTLLPSASAFSNYTGTTSRASAPFSASISEYSSNTASVILASSSASANAIQETTLASLLGPIEDLQTANQADWDDETESACSAALLALHGVATNPSGIAACYNVRNLVTSSGIFEIDLRLYRISAPMQGWLKLNPSSVGVGLAYVNATVSAKKEQKVKREDQTLPWFPAQRDEAADIYIRRSTGIPPRRLESMAFVGTVEHGALAELKNTAMTLSLLTPAIILSGSEQDGTPINTQLSVHDASFVNGVFAKTRAGGSPAKTMKDFHDYMVLGNTLAEFPTGLIISSIWAVLYLMVMGYGTVSRYQARESYRRRVKHRFSGDGITKRTLRWA